MPRSAWIRTTRGCSRRASETAAPGPVLVVGPGTGLGAAVLHPASARHRGAADRGRPDRIRAGQRARDRRCCAGCSSARAMSRPNSCVSGPGLVNLYEAICAIDGVDAGPARAGRDQRGRAPRRRDRRATPCSPSARLLGSVIGDLAVIASAKARLHCRRHPAADRRLPAAQRLPCAPARQGRDARGARTRAGAADRERTARRDRRGELVSAAPARIEQELDRYADTPDPRITEMARGSASGGWEPSGSTTQPVGGERNETSQERFCRLSIVAALGVVGAASAQEAATGGARPTRPGQQDATDLDTVVVKGIRGAIEAVAGQPSASEDTRVEVITSEDIGKMPDKNVADSLARVPGVTISAASANEGAFDENDRVSHARHQPQLHPDHDRRPQHRHRRLVRAQPVRHRGPQRQLLAAAVGTGRQGRGAQVVRSQAGRRRRDRHRRHHHPQSAQLRGRLQHLRLR